MSTDLRVKGTPDGASAKGGRPLPPPSAGGRAARMRHAARTLVTAEPSARCLSAVREFVAELRPHIDELAEEMAVELHRLAPDIEYGPDAFEGTRLSCRANLVMLFTQLPHAAGRKTIGVPAEALAYAQVFVREGVPLTTLQRLYRIGYAIVWRAWLELVMSRLDDRALITEVLDYWNTFTFTYVDTVLDKLTSEYAEERERWVRSAAAVRADTVKAILAGGPVDVEEAGRRLHYALGRRHVAFLVWDAGPGGSTSVQAALERAALRRVKAIGSVDTLLVPVGLDVIAGWIGVHRDADLSPVDRLPPASDELPGIRIAFGSLGTGLEGFRSTHDEAVLARRVACLLPHRGASVTHYGDIALLALLTQDLDQARHFVIRELGRLGRDDTATRRLVETVRLYFEESLSPARVARRLGIHENTVAYRLRRAEELLGRQLADRRSELVAAITLRDAVGVGPPSRPS